MQNIFKIFYQRLQINSVGYGPMATSPENRAAELNGGSSKELADFSGVNSAKAVSFLNHLEWTALRRLDGQLQGNYRSLFKGDGLDLSDLREYQLHDDVRHIDWNVTARTQTPYVREHQEDREMTAWLLVDCSASMAFSSNTKSKFQLGVEWVGLISRILTRQGNRVGALFFNGQLVRSDGYISAKTGRAHVLHLIERLLHFSDKKIQGDTHLSTLLDLANVTIRRRSTLFIVSDFFSQPGWEKSLAHLSRRHDVIAVRLRDPFESTLPQAGMVLIEDAETNEQILVDCHDEKFRSRYLQVTQEREEQLRNCFSKAGVDCLELATDEPLDQALLRFVRLRKKRIHVI